MLARSLLSASFCVVLASLSLLLATGQPLGPTSIELGGFLASSSLEYVVNRVDPRAGGKDTITMVYTVPEEVWISIGFSSDGRMIKADAVIGLPDSGEVKKYSLGSYIQTGIFPLPEEQQTLIDTSIVQENGNTTMEFTKILEEEGEIPIAIGANNFIGAYGFGNAFFVHKARETFAVDLVAGEAVTVETRNRKLWKIHGWVASLAWGILSPLAIGASMLRKWFPNALWLKIHQFLNYAVVGLSIMAFASGVAAIQSESTAPQHFYASPNPHRFVGLVLFVLVLFQIVSGQFRPNNPAKGEEKPWTRRAWEILHRVLGLSLLALAWYQVESGIRIYQSIFADSAGINLSAIFWGIVGSISGLVVVGFFVSKATDKNEEEAESSEHEEVEKADIAKNEEESA
eukprot:CAMPEP_0201243398 /NCGR_PEP_ID=MMETSP0852-20130820/41163_1 /ASSEMBLY_ACC=CAM_ASM_000632 /TAXON_ID=183588 /ORGANISM="Pseudo-nitzschia fraudulenta, Strain WWA7" /LENGTH=400 /DNA_ID=CAMNT_0047540415 /DNA_START=146 /DNA_END=1348 /DNA_ORIENTATION=-